MSNNCVLGLSVLFVSQSTETPHPITLHVVQGAIPSDFPSGTYYLTGPGLFTDDHGSTVHPLDGHGYLRAFRIDGAAKQVKFMAKGKRFGNVKVMKNVANTGVLRWGGRLLCLWEGGDPYEIESETLDTVGSFNVINGSNVIMQKKGTGDLLDVATRLLKQVLHGVFKMPPKRLLSHYKLDAQRNRLLAISCNAEDIIPDHLMIHDWIWAFTDTRYILFGNRIKLDVIESMTAVSGLSPMISALSAARLESAAGSSLPEVAATCWQCFEVKDVDDNSSKLVLVLTNGSISKNYLVRYNWQSGQLDPSIMNVKQGDELLHLVQISINLDSNGNCQECSMKKLSEWSKPSDFPVINPELSGKKNECIYASTSSGSRQALPHFPFDMVVKINLSTKTASTWSAGARRFIGEPIFVSKGTEEEDGYILAVEYAVSIQRCYLVILDPKRIGETDAVVARLEVPKHLNFPLGFHGFWDNSN
ncbi:hypothetical protein F3Y22_tig00110890pilonHSYRG00028 [Hibiscus syriacus]|uniref:Carotenoid cleavage dioxygenase 7 n=1 Tax=Hibiscus syriacus TaxID=106335 RepID=A0A6A2ZJ80_HIBSY|nr:hypothetical protein F3Y22_tig00110890pilonHSYRG00028 [Hibiscus syriacus]